MPVGKGGKMPPSERHVACHPRSQSQVKYMNSGNKRHITPGQCRAARGLLNISQRQLADAAEVSLSAIQDFETEARKPRAATLKAIEDALENAGVEFIPVNGGGAGVRHRSADQATL